MVPDILFVAEEGIREHVMKQGSNYSHSKTAIQQI